MNNLIKYFSFSILCIILISCESETKFDKFGWSKKSDLNSFPNREKMLNDLMKNYKIKGLKYSEIIDLLGEPEIRTTSDSFSAVYNIETEYGNDIDPIYVKELEISLNKDSVAQNCIITNWKK